MSKLCSSHLTEDQCWEFLATHMAPLTISQQDHKIQAPVEFGVKQRFFEELTEHLHLIPPNKVGAVLHGPLDAA